MKLELGASGETSASLRPRKRPAGDISSGAGSEPGAGTGLGTRGGNTRGVSLGTDGRPTRVSNLRTDGKPNSTKLVRIVESHGGFQ